MQDITTSLHHERSLPLLGGAGGGLLLSSAYLAPVHYYTKLYRSALTGVTVVEEQADHYVKQTYRNRCIIAGDDGPIALTIPVSGSTLAGKTGSSMVEGEGKGCLSKTPMHSVQISDHGAWRHQHWQAIVSAYRSSPYFEYYADDFERVFHNTTARLVDFNAALRDFILDCLDLHPQIVVNTANYLPSSEGDYRETIRPKNPYDFDPTFHPTPYWQVFASRHGFIPNLSIIDLLFNMGPESRLVLRNSCSS